jgi:hypothetical protein
VKDIILNNYIELGAPNVLKEEKKAEATGDKYRLNPFLARLILPLARRNPQWLFIHSHDKRTPLDSDGVRDVTHFIVYEGGEELGWIRRGTRWGSGINEQVFEFDNSRLRSKRQRGGSTMTKDRARAIRTIENTFYAKTNEEWVAIARNVVATKTNQISASAGVEVMRTKSRLGEPLWDYALGRWDTVGPEICASEAEAAKVPEQVETVRQTGEIHDKWTNSKVWVVVLRGSRYLVEHQANREVVQVMESDELPDRLRLGIGMLKLQEVGEMIPGIGVRAADDVFMVTEEEQTT